MENIEEKIGGKLDLLMNKYTEIEKIIEKDSKGRQSPIEYKTEDQIIPPVAERKKS